MNMNKNIEPLDDKSYPHGYWERYMANTLWFKKFFINGISNGYEEKYKLEIIDSILQIDDSNITLTFNL